MSSDILNGNTNYSDSNSHLSHGNYMNTMNQQAQYYQQLSQSTAQAQNQQQSLPSKYSYQSGWQEISNLIYNKWYDKSSVQNEENADLHASTLSNSDIREEGFRASKAVFTAVFVYLIGLVGVIIGPLVSKGSGLYISLSVATVTWFTYILFFQHVYLSTREFVWGAVERRLYKIMVNGYSVVKTTALLSSFAAVGFFSYLIYFVEPSATGKGLMALIQHRVTLYGAGGYLTHLILFCFGFLFMLIFIEKAQYKKYAEKAKQRRVLVDMEVNPAGTVAHKIMTGEYDKED